MQVRTVIVLFPGRARSDVVRIGRAVQFDERVLVGQFLPRHAGLEFRQRVLFRAHQTR